MALTEQTVIDKIEIVGPYRSVQVRTARVIYDSDQEISRTFARHVLAPNADITGETAEVQAVCAAVHTPAIILAYEASLASAAT
jgi:hypothetical protein